METDWLIVGGGVAGLFLATMLARQGKTFLLLEQSEPAVDAGAGLLLAPNATRILQQLGLFDAAAAKGRCTNRWFIRDQSGMVLRELQIPRNGPPALSIHRGDLIALLRSNLPSCCMQTGRKVVSVIHDQDGMRLQLADGKAASGKALIGADGIRSVVRKHLFGDKPLLYRGYVGWRGIAPFVPAGLDDGILSESWGPGGRFGVAPVDAGRTYWYASANQGEGWADEGLTRKAILLDRFQHWHKPVMDLIASTPEKQILVSRIYDAPKLRHWSNARIALIGDAAHAMTPNLGQGACQAIEDAWMLGSMIVRYPEIKIAFDEYQRRRIKRVSSIQNQSRAMGWIVQTESSWALALRRWLTPRIPEALVRVGMRAVFAEQFL